MKLLQVSLDALIAMYYNCTVKTCYTEIGKQSLVLFSCTYWPGKELLFTQGVIANEAADPRGSAVELANHRAVREYRRKISSQRKGLFLTIFGCK